MALNQRTSRQLKDLAYKLLDAAVDDLDTHLSKEQTKVDYETRLTYLRATLREVHSELMEMVN